MACKIFVGGIQSSTTDEALRKHFDQFGTIRDAVVMRDRGFGFVTFEKEQAAKDAVAQSSHVVDGQTVAVKEATASKAKSGGGGVDGNVVTDKVFVGGLPQDCSDDKVRDYFGIYGKIIDAVVMKDRDTNRSRGFGFVQYDNTESVDKVIAEYADHKIGGKWVEVKRSVPRDKMPPTSSRGGGGADSPGGQPDYGHPACGAYGGYSMTPPPPGGSYPYGQFAHPSYGAYGYHPSYAAYGAYGPCGPYGCGGPPPSGYPGYPGYPPPGYPGYPGYPGCYPSCPPSTQPAAALTNGDSRDNGRKSRRRSRSRSSSRSSI